MSNTVIKVENLGKQYRLGEIGTGTLSHDLNRAWARLRGKEDPFAKIGDTNDRTTKGSSDFVWSLKDINFEVRAGEVLGIIGRNGAGKSTLLKILSKVTAPTTGRINIKGRIASLLEVGTGFHPELTGRENIFLNGAILGMTKIEIRNKFDEIVDFSGVERYIDTPVKRYSSGMYVRLAFAVSAFLEPEILIVDEVLAVGDAEFQKKCLGRMKDVSVNDGRTVLFVSHNIAAVRGLCTNGLLLNQGRVESFADISTVLNDYFSTPNDEVDGGREINKNKKDNYFLKWYLQVGDEQRHYCEPRQELSFCFEFVNKVKLNKAEVGFQIRGNDGEIVYGTNSRDRNGLYFELTPGIHKFVFDVRLPIRDGNYEIDVAIAENDTIVDHWISKTRLELLSKEKDTVLSESVTGILRELSHFSKVKTGSL
ncbi:ABC transporter ATP-binding protein [Hymenobacter setariae]|uniref:ABC transporter ATP-binding protein n=1 Tax=Hymenobacter setariae TaxID=2594794 RepID=A0A558BP15_9BACT|nr:ABC transporter ATP-binding protein [Hymenobacter setariae]TVT38260.1 ABC transporter ATP-binding protein [Hymenobacter setariae]